MTSRFVASTLIALGALVWSVPAAAQVVVDSSPATEVLPGITVFGAGKLDLKPDLAEIELRVSGKAELTEDAIVKYCEAKKRTLEALGVLEIKDLEIKEQGLTVSIQVNPEFGVPAAAFAMPNAAPNAGGIKIPIEIASTLKLRLKAIQNLPQDELMKTIGKIMDVGHDTNSLFGSATAGPTSGALVRFVVSDLEAQRENAYEIAVADARERGKRLAKLSGVKLGRTIAVQEFQGPSEEISEMSPYGVPIINVRDGNEIVTDKLGETPFRVKLMVRFAIAE